MYLSSIRLICLQGYWSHSKQKLAVALPFRVLLIPVHFSNKYEHLLFPGRQPMHWLRFKLLTRARYRLQMAQFIPHGAISSFEIGFNFFIFVPNLKLRGNRGGKSVTIHDGITCPGCPLERLVICHNLLY